MRRLARWLGRQAYASFVPGAASYDGAQSYLEDVWRAAPVAAVLQAVMAAAACVLAPLLVGRLRPLPSLSPDDRERALAKLLASPLYPLRTLGYAVKGTALMAVLRDAEARRSLLPASAADPFPKAAARAQSHASNGLWEADYVVIGSGASGASAAALLAQSGADTLIVEEGPWLSRPDFGEDLFSSVSRMFRDFGMQAARGRSFIPVLQGRCVGGSTVISGAILHRLAESVYEEWARADPSLRRALPLAEIEAEEETVERAVDARPNVQLAGLPAAAALGRLGWAHNAMVRAAPGCRGSGRCLQGCPSGGKLSMEASFVPAALQAGARVLAGWRARRILTRGPRAVGAGLEDSSGRSRDVVARKAVLVAAGAVHSPLLLARSGLGGARVGRHFQCHLSVGAAGLLDRPVREVEGPPQGLEVLEFSRDGVKLATQLVPPELILARAPFIGRELARLLSQSDRISSWMAVVRSQAEGAVRTSIVGSPRIAFDPADDDMRKARLGLSRIARLLFELGAREVYSGIVGLPARLASVDEARAIESAPLDPRRYFLGIGHVFGTCRMSSHPSRGVVGPDFRVHGAENLFVVDASVFPTNTGVNPQLPIMALARCAARRALLGPGQVRG